MQYARRKCRLVKAGGVGIGGGSPISVQGMTNVPTREAQACLEQIGRMCEAGCELVRVAAATKEDTAALREIVKGAKAPIIADVHFHFERAIEAVEAGAAKIRLNPGNIQDRAEVEKVIAACRRNGAAIRVGVNEGSIRERKDEEVKAREAEKGLAELMAEKMREYVRIFEENHFDQLVLSAKCHDAARTIAVNRALAETFDYPLHLGVTHAGTVHTGSIRSAAALGALLAEGIGDTVRVSLTGDPVREIEVAEEILCSLGLRARRRPELIACPTCGRTEIDIEGVAAEVEAALAGVRRAVKVAVMGCVVNGPGEAADADVALCGGRDKAVIYRSGERVAVVPAADAVEALLREVRRFAEGTST